MKLKHILTLGLLAFVGQTMADTDKVLMTIDGKPVYQSEFDYIYNKNNDANTIDKKSKEEYMDLFINFKLKVEEAKAHGMDTTEAFTKELAGYRKQLAQPYMVDEAAKEALLQEAYKRKLTDVEVSHILIQIPQNASAADTLAAYERALVVKDRVLNRENPENFEVIAREMSNDPSAQQNGGYLGFVPVFRTVYPFETGVYNTPVGEISDPVRSSFGYHIIKVHSHRPAQGEVLVAHIMTFTAQGDSQKNEQAKAKIDSLYQLIQNGADFAQVAKDNSEDHGSATNGGKMPWFGTGRMVPDFEKAAFALKEKNEICAPVQSMYGWHIIKLLDTKAMGSFEDIKDDLKKSIERDSRNAKTSESFVEKLKIEYNFKVNRSVLPELYTLAANHTIGDSVFTAKAKHIDGIVCHYADKTHSVAELVDYMATHSNTTKSIPQEIVDEKVAAFAKEKLMAHEDAQLERKYTPFRNLIKEYHDGILLFEISNQKVWERSSTDVKGLSKFFKRHKRQYAWDAPRYKGQIVYCKDSLTLEAAQGIAKKADKDSIENYLYKRLNDSIQYVRIERGVYAQGDNEVIDSLVFTQGTYAASEEYPYVFLVGKQLKKYPESYEDARGAVVSDYQTYLEEEWIKDMRKRYKVIITDE